MAEDDIYGAQFEFNGEWDGGGQGAGGLPPSGAPEYAGYEALYGIGDAGNMPSGTGTDDFASDALKAKIENIGDGRLRKYQQWKDRQLRKTHADGRGANVADYSSTKRSGANMSIFEELGVAPPPIGEIILPPDDHMTIFDIDPSKYQTQPWTVDTAVLSKWFNYELNEHSWREYARNQRAIRKELTQLVQAHVEVHGFNDPPIQLSATFETALAHASRIGTVPNAIPHVLAQAGRKWQETAMPHDAEANVQSDLPSNTTTTWDPSAAPQPPVNSTSDDVPTPSMPSHSAASEGPGRVEDRDAMPPVAAAPNSYPRESFSRRSRSRSPHNNRVDRSRGAADAPQEHRYRDHPRERSRWDDGRDAPYRNDSRAREAPASRWDAGDQGASTRFDMRERGGKDDRYPTRDRDHDYRGRDREGGRSWDRPDDHYRGGRSSHSDDRDRMRYRDDHARDAPDYRRGGGSKGDRGR